MTNNPCFLDKLKTIEGGKNFFGINYYAEMHHLFFFFQIADSIPNSI